MDFHNHAHVEYGRFEQILSQFLLKGLHIILDSRVPSIRPSGRSSQVKKTDKWFNLVLGDRPAALDKLNFWHRNLMEPMIIDIIIVQDMPSSLSDQSGECITSGYGTLVETVVERWVLEYESPKTPFPPVVESSASYKKIYKKSIILLRSLYSMMRLLPAYRVFRKLSVSSRVSDFDINYKVSSFSAPFTRAEEEVMKQYTFSPIDAQQGRLSVSVKYRESLSDFNLETSTSFPPQIITDYMGSPATDPMRAFPSKNKGAFATSYSPVRGMQSPSSPFQRPHSWTSGIHKGPPLPYNQNHGGSPPAYAGRYDFSSSPTDIFGHRNQNHRPPTNRRGNSFDEYQLSPPFSPSTSPSPPTYLSSGNYAQSRLRSDTAPVSIPHPMMGRSPRYLSPNLSDPNRNSLPPPSPRSTKYDTSSQESPSGIRSLRKSEISRAGELSSGLGQKMSRDSKDDSGRFSALLSSSGSPRIGFSRSSSRLSIPDDLDDIDFSCPFIVDDVDPSDSPTSQNQGGKKSSEITSHAFSMNKKSQEAAVGALVHMLRTAPPLRQDSSCYSSDALEELRAYKEMKDLLLSKSGTCRKDEL